MKDLINKIFNEPCQETVKRMRAVGIKADMVITSPPYWGLRKFEGAAMIWDGEENCKHDFTDEVSISHNQRGGRANKDFKKKPRIDNPHSSFCNKCGAWKGQLGLEPDFRDYIRHLCEIMDGMGDILADTGSLWVNIGDTSSSKSGRMRAEFSVSWPRYEAAASQMNFEQPKTNLPKKCLVGIPERFMIEMIDRGWVLRNKIVWHKPNAFPQSSKDSFTVDFDMFYWFVKKPLGYYFEQQFEPYQSNAYDIKKPRNKGGERYAQTAYGGINSPISGGTRDWYKKGERKKRCVWNIATGSNPYAHFATFPNELITTPIKACSPAGGIVYDPFGGSCTTAEECIYLNRNYIITEIAKEYCDIGNERTAIAYKKVANKKAQMKLFSELLT